MASFVRTGKKIVAIGRNYAAHAKELGNAAPKEPFFFLKPTSSYVPSGGNVEIPQGIVAHHEVELGLVIGKGGRDISQANAQSHISGYTLAVDMTARNLQDKVKKQGLPWSAAKGFDTFTPIGPFVPKSLITDPHDLRLKLAINGVTKQNGTTADMIFQIPRLIEHISSIMTLEVLCSPFAPLQLDLIVTQQEGDVILTGTPPGVGPVVAGDYVECSLSDPSGQELAKLEFNTVDRQGGYRFQAD